MAGHALTSDILFRSIYEALKKYGKESSPRGLKIKEIENFDYTLPPYVRFVNYEARKLNVDYIKREFLWYLRGDAHDVSIAEHAKLWQQYIKADGTINSNYGQYIFGQLNQFDRAAQILKEDKDSRRACIMILNKDHVLSDDADLPCTYSISFRIREGRLNMQVRMRSQDAVFGMGSDAPCFSFVHEMMWRTLQETYPDLKFGYYNHSADSFHIYERHFEMLNKIVAGDPYTEVRCPKISCKAEVDFIRQGDFSVIPEGFEFARWLTTFEKG